MADAQLINIDKISQFLDIGILTALIQAQTEFADTLVAEMPNYTGKARSSVIKIPIQKSGNTYTATVGIVDQAVLAYMYAYWKGVPGDVTITAHKKFMVFDRWNNGPDELKWKDGRYHFVSVVRTYSAHDFVERAITKFTPRFTALLGQNVTIGFR